MGRVENNAEKFLPACVMKEEVGYSFGVEPIENHQFNITAIQFRERGVRRITTTAIHTYNISMPVGCVV